jgi:hypothetical protein
MHALRADVEILEKELTSFIGWNYHCVNAVEDRRRNRCNIDSGRDGKIVGRHNESEISNKCKQIKVIYEKLV